MGAGRLPASVLWLSGTSPEANGRYMPDRRFPPPWSVDEENAACYIVRDHDGASLA
jgi:hypothetical protein